MKITNPDVYKLPLASMRACLVSIEYWLDREGGITKEPYDALVRVYEELLLLTNRIGYPCVKAG